MGKRGPVAPGAARTSGIKTAVSSRVFSPSPYLSALAKRYWKSVVAAFPAGHFTESDRVLLEQFCVSAALHQETTIFLGKNDRYVTDRYGREMLHPAVKEQHQARCDCAMLATKLRITKTSMITPKNAGRASSDADAVNGVKDEFSGLLYDGDERRRQ